MDIWAFPKNRNPSIAIFFALRGKLRIVGDRKVGLINQCALDPQGCFVKLDAEQRENHLAGFKKVLQ